MATSSSSSPPGGGPKLFNAREDVSMTKHVGLYSERFFRLDAIRISKLLEMAQYAILSFWFNILIGGFLDKMFPAYDPTKNIYLVGLEITGQIAFLSTFVYYSKKFLAIIPFFFALSKSYIPNLKGEASVGMSAAPLALLATQTNLLNKVKLLQARFTGTAPPPGPKPVSYSYTYPAAG